MQRKRVLKESTKLKLLKTERKILRRILRPTRTEMAQYTYSMVQSPS